MGDCISGMPTIRFNQTLSVCPRLIGRATQLERVEELFIQSRAGRAQVLLISGEAGIGKTRLVAEADQEPPRKKKMT